MEENIWPVKSLEARRGDNHKDWTLYEARNDGLGWLLNKTLGIVK